MMIMCEICGIRDGDNVRTGDHTKLGEAIDIKLPLHGRMIGSPNKERDIPPPFPQVDDWLQMKCPRCARVPWMFTEKELTRYIEQGGPDRVYTDEGWLCLNKYLEGGQAFHSGQQLEENPYPQDTDYFEQWFSGYVDADAQESGGSQ